MRRVIILFLIVGMLLLVSITVSATITVSDISPSPDATNIGINPTLSVDINLSDGSLFNWSIDCNGQSVSGVAAVNGTYSLNLTNLEYNAEYGWIVIVDSVDSRGSFTYFFTTEIGEDEGGEDSFSGEINIFPESPTSGEMFAVILENRISTEGYIWVKNKMYPVSIHNGFGTVAMDDNVYGDAYIWLYGENASSGMSKTFKIKCGLEGTFSITVEAEAIVNDLVEINADIGGEPVADAEILITDPLGVPSTLHTNDGGTATLVLDKVGDWLVRCVFLGQSTVKEIKVAHKPLSIVISGDEHIIGDDVRVNTEENAVVEITRDGVIKLQSNAINGILIFTPNEPGHYKATATLGNKRGSKDFNVFQSVTIKVFDLDNMQVSRLNVEEKYMVKVVDSRDRTVSDFAFVYYGLGETIPLSGGFGFWTPSEGGDTTLYLEDLAGFISNELNVLVDVDGISDSGFDFLPVAVIGFVFVGIGILLYLFRNKLRDKLPAVFKGLFKPKREVPI